ncbi:MAG: hypothetical protein ACJAXW_004196 [Candidatus Azotimanducaceae bacterium]
MVERNSLLEQLRLALKREFGRSCEASPGQHDLFDEAEAEQDPDHGTDAIDEVATSEAVADNAAARKKPGRKPYYQPICLALNWFLNWMMLQRTALKMAVL